MSALVNLCSFFMRLSHIDESAQRNGNVYNAFCCVELRLSYGKLRCGSLIHVGER